MTQIPPPPSPARKGLLGEILSDVLAVEAPHTAHVQKKEMPRSPQEEISAAKKEFIPYPPNPASFCISFEFFPPHTDEGLEKLKVTSRMLSELYPDYYSVTFGAAGSIQHYTVNTVLALKQNTSIPITPHISCIGTTPESVYKLLQNYKQAGIRSLVVLRGDKPSGMVAAGHFRYAMDLVKFIRREYGDYFFIEVAAYPEYHPESLNPDADFKHFQMKVAAGANRAITQYFYNVDSFWYFVERCQKANVTVPIIPGIMPITNYKQLKRFSDGCGAEIPRWLRLRLAQYADDPISLQQLGLDFVTRMCQQLLEQGAPGLHFYTINKAEPSMAICQRLQWKHLKTNILP